jgi:4-amino-4-deoxy-L-arabinose transferase-like glycosyltransferase
VNQSAPAPQRRPRLSGWTIAMAGVLAVALIATSTRYGYHRDELYFIAAGAHPAFGYPDQPPLVPLLCQAMHHIAPASLTMLRLPSALAATATTMMAALIARELGGSTRVQVIATACTAVSAVALVTGHFVTTTTFDLLTTSVLCWLIIRAVNRHSGPTLLAAGVTVGIGAEAKPQIIFVAALLLVGMAIVGPRWPLRSAWLAAGVLVAAALAAPYLIWQATHGWPQVTVAHNIGGSAEGGRTGFIPFQLIMVSPLLVPVWIAGLIAPFRRDSLRLLRFLPVAYLLLAIAYLLGNGKAYYLASLYPTLLGIGAIPVAEWTRRETARTTGSRGGGGRVLALTSAIVVSAVVSAFVALPLLPASALQGSAIVGVNPDQAETVGWPDFITSVAAAWQTIPDSTRTQAVVFTHNYGEAGAIDLLGRTHGLPRAYSGHNGFSEWGRPEPDQTTVLLIGYSSYADAAPYFTDCTTAGHVDNAAGLDNDERGLPIMICQVARAGWAANWDRLTHYN